MSHAQRRVALRRQIGLVAMAVPPVTGSTGFRPAHLNDLQLERLALSILVPSDFWIPTPVSPLRFR
jgi:hypothetical protein